MTVRLFCFFQAEDGIRDVAVTGVQTCALPISKGSTRLAEAIVPLDWMHLELEGKAQAILDDIEGLEDAEVQSLLEEWRELEGSDRSEERRVGKECRSRWSPYH